MVKDAKHYTLRLVVCKCHRERYTLRRWLGCENTSLYCVAPATSFGRSFQIFVSQRSYHRITKSIKREILGKTLGQKELTQGIVWDQV